MQSEAAYAERITGLPEILRHLRFEQGRREEAQKAAKAAERKQQAQRATPSKPQTRRTTRFYGD
jgi:hypothetical protein